MEKRRYTLPSGSAHLLLVLLVVILAGATACREPQVEEPTPDNPAATAEPGPSPLPPTPTSPADDAVGETTTATTTGTALAGLPLIDDFESGPLVEERAGSVSVGYLTWSDGSPVSIDTVAVEAGDELARPDQEGTNGVLQLETAVAQGGWAGFSHAFSGPGGSEWIGQDWSGYEGLSFWLYGRDTGGTLFVDLLENRNPDATGDDAERWTVDIADDFSGWQQFTIPFTEFRRKEIGNGAPNDGLALTDVHGYAVGTFGSVAMGAQSYYLDQVELYGVAPIRPVEVAFAEAQHSVSERGRSNFEVRLSKVSTETVTVDYAVAYGVAEPGRDYEPVSGTLTFAPGEMAQTFSVVAIEDSVPEGQERLLLMLSNPAGAELGFQQRALLTIRDNDQPDEHLLLAFDTAPPFVTGEGITLTTVEVGPGDALAQPEQTGYESVLQVDTSAAAAPATVGRTYPSAQDWSAYDGLGLWVYGRESGREITVELLANRLTTTAELPPDGWELVWSDEFDTLAGTPPNPAFWQPEIGDGTLNGIPGWGNSELETYTASTENATTDGEGHLVITARELPEDVHLPCWYGRCEYSSARLITWNRVEQAYGRIEARIRLPQGQGLWPAFWMLGTNLDEVSWPQSGEIDIMEHIGREPSTVHGTVHGPGYSGGEGIGEGYELTEGTFADDFHTFAVEWQPDEIRWFVDEVSYATVTPDDLPPGSEWVYDHPFFIILNLAVGGNWPGNPDDTTVFPQTMLVDYVRVYGAPESAERFTTSFVDDFRGWQQISLPFTGFSSGAGESGTALELTDIWGYAFTVAPATDPLYIDRLRLEQQ